jgi:hypothetical protein
MSNNDPQVSVVLPCLNERATVGECVTEALQAFEKAGVRCEVVVCDNGSTDGSATEASEAGACVVSESRRGYGSAYKAGIAATRGKVLLLADADGTYPLDEAPEFAQRAAESGGLVLGSRFGGRILPGSMPFLHRFVGSPATRLLLRVLFGVRCSDPHSGMRAMKREVFDQIEPESRGMEFAIEMVVNASRRTIPIIDLPITYRARSGESKLRALPDGWALLRFLLLHSPTFFYVGPGLSAMAVGMGLLAWLATGDRTVGSATFGVNTLVVGSLLTVVGYQTLAFGVSATVYLTAPAGGGRALRTSIKRLFTLERGLIVGLALLVAGFALLASVGARWIATDLGNLARQDHGIAIVGLTIAVVGLQTVFVSFFLSLVGRDEAPSREP